MIKRYLIPTLVLIVPLITIPGFYNAYFNPKLFVIVTLAGLMVCFGYPKDVHYIVMVLILLNILNLFYTQNPYYTRIAVALNISCLLFYQFVRDNVTPDRIKYILLAIVISGIIVASIAILNRFSIYPITNTGYKALHGSITSTIGNSNFIGCYLLFPLFASIYYAIKNKRWFYYLPVAILFGGLIVARARASWLGFAIGLTVFLFIYLRGKRKTLIIILFAFILAGGTLLSVPIHKKWYSTKEIGLRLKYWQGSLRLWAESPLYGTGMWSYRNKVYEAQAKLIKANPDWMGKYQHKPRRAHNMYLELLNDGGVIYFVFIMVLFGQALKSGFHYLAENKDRLLMASLVCCVISVMVAGFFFFPLRALTTCVMIHVILGCIHAISRYTIMMGNARN